MNLAALKTEIANVLINTTNATATEKQKLRDRCVARYPSDWLRYLAENTLTDTATNRGKFLVEKTVGNNPPGMSGLWSDIFISGSDKENVATLPPPDPWGI